MFCIYCNHEIDEGLVVCPNCGKELGDGTLVLNPLPKKTIDIVTSQEQANQHIIVEDSADVEEIYDNKENTAGPVAYDLEFGIKNDSDELVEQESVDVPGETNTNEEVNITDGDSEDLPVIKEKGKTAVIIITIISVALLAVAIYFVIRYMKSNNEVKNDASTGTTTEAKATSTDSNTEVPEMHENNLIVAKQIEIDNKKVDATDIVNYSSDDGKINTTSFVVDVDKDTAILYMDEQEVLLQNSDTKIINVRYVSGLFCYEYPEVIQYGLYADNKLLLLEVSGTTSDIADELAINYFAERGYLNVKE